MAETIFYSPENGWSSCHDNDMDKPFEFVMRDGVTFRIDSVLTIYQRTIKKQLAEGGKVQIKFCVRDDEELDGSDNVEQWQLVFFPMYIKGEEIPHGAIVSHQDSAINGNLILQNGEIVDASSNHHLMGYQEIQDKVVEFAKEQFECIFLK